MTICWHFIYPVHLFFLYLFAHLFTVLEIKAQVSCLLGKWITLKMISKAVSTHI